MGITRQAKRQLLRAIAEAAIRKTLGDRVPRKFRRNVGRIYANCAYQQPWPLEKSKYSKFTPHQGIVDWIVKQSEKIMDEQRGN